MSRLVLIVEDNEICAETLQIALELIPGVEIRSIPGPLAAIAILNEPGSDVAAIITDLNLHWTEARNAGIGNGLDLIRQLRTTPRFARLPILLISGDSNPRLAEHALAHGADAFFAKPYSPSAVRRKLEQLLC
jgi:CheY-like chemotaxis protein